MNITAIIRNAMPCILGVLVILSCSGGDDRELHNKIRGPLAFVMRDAKYSSYRNSDENTRDAWVEISYPEVSGGNGEAVVRINDAVLSHVSSLVAGYVPGDDNGSAGIEALASQFLAAHDEFVTEFPDAAIGHEWQCEIDGAVLHNSSTCITVAFKLFAYTGGAHPNHGVTILSFDTATGDILTLEDIISDRKAFTAIAEKEFRHTYRIPPGSSLNESGFLFDDNVFTLTDNFGVQGDGLHFIYPLYAVAPYVFGIIEFDVPYSAFSSLLVRKDLFE